jgi:hypothetical protein
MTAFGSGNLLGHRPELSASGNVRCRACQAWLGPTSGPCPNVSPPVTRDPGLAAFAEVLALLEQQRRGAQRDPGASS